MKILLAVDGSPYTRRMVDYLLSHRELFNASHDYTVLNVHLPLPHHAASVVGREVTDDYYREESEAVVAPVVSELQAMGLRVTGAWTHGLLGETIARYAQEGGFELILMGSHGHGALGRLVTGSVTTRVLSHCQVAVLLVR